MSVIGIRHDAGWLIRSRVDQSTWFTITVSVVIVGPAMTSSAVIPHLFLVGWWSLAEAGIRTNRTRFLVEIAIAIVRVVSLGSAHGDGAGIRAGFHGVSIAIVADRFIMKMILHGSAKFPFETADLLNRLVRRFPALFLVLKLLDFRALTANGLILKRTASRAQAE